MVTEKCHIPAPPVSGKLTNNFNKKASTMVGKRQLHHLAKLMCCYRALLSAKPKTLIQEEQAKDLK